MELPSCEQSLRTGVPCITDVCRRVSALSAHLARLICAINTQVNTSSLAYTIAY